jgi:hypothetical protein
MQTKVTEKEKAIKLRKEGKSYAEILKVVPVVKSTLSLWLREVGLAKAQKQRLTEKKLASAKRGGLAKRTQRIKNTSLIIDAAVKEIGILSIREHFLLGVALYWAEGSKQKEHNTSQQIVFANSDPNMIEYFLYWLEIIGISRENIYFELYVHTGDNVSTIVDFWAKKVKEPVFILKQRIYYKKGNIKTLRKNVGDNYFGLIRVRVRSSTDLNRKVQGWVQGILKSS